MTRIRKEVRLIVLIVAEKTGFIEYEWIDTTLFCKTL